MFGPLVVLAAAIAWPGAAHAQEPSGDRGTDGRWVVASLPQVDLWYHGLAVVGFQGFGPLDYYDRGYAERVRAEKERQGVFPTALDGNASRFRAAFERDSTFEVLHFLPLYFASAGRAAMLEALRAVAGGADPASATDPTARFGASVAAMLLTRPAQRELLVEFVDALEEEWDSFYSEYWTGITAANMESFRRIQAEWDGRFAPALAAYQSNVNLQRGAIIVSAALGEDGRIFEGDENDPRDNLVAVRLRSDAPDASLYSAVREMCYPVVRRALVASEVDRRDRVSAERESSRAAVRCGAMLLERVAPQLANGYMQSFPSLAPAEAEPEEVTQEFLRAYPIDPSLELALRTELERVAGV